MRAEDDVWDDDDRDEDGLRAHRAVLGLRARPRPSVADVKRAFTETARRSHPDASSSSVETCGRRFREAVTAREALLRAYGGVRGGVDGSGGVSSSSFRRAASGGGGRATTFAAVMATPFVAAVVVSFALPKATEERAVRGSERGARMGRVDGWMNPPRNEWLREDAREAGDGNARRFWKTGRVTAAAGTTGQSRTRTL